MFPPANSSQQLCVAILLQQDIAVENNETFSIQLTTEDPQVTVSPKANTSIVTILDDDGMLLLQPSLVFVYKDIS